MQLSARIAGSAAAALVLTTQTAPAAAQDGFLFDQPMVTVTVRGGFNAARANSDVFDFFTDELTLERGDFSGMTFAGDLGLRLSPYADLVLGISRTSTSQRSEFLDWVDLDNLPIEQTTSLKHVPITATLKVYPLARGRSIGANAWIPARLTPFIGAGGGALRYELTQDGDFVDFETLEIFTDRFSSEGWTETLHVLAGSDYWFTPRLGVSAEGRYTWASAPLERDFRRFDDIDLSGFQATVGLSMRF
jgi:hypothetical protein